MEGNPFPVLQIALMMMIAIVAMLGLILWLIGNEKRAGKNPPPDPWAIDLGEPPRSVDAYGRPCDIEETNTYDSPRTKELPRMRWQKKGEWN